MTQPRSTQLYDLNPASQRRHVIGIVLVPAIFFLIAMGMLVFHGISAFQVALLAFTYVLTTIGVEVGYHRHFSHRAFEASPVVRKALAILGATAAQGPALYWVALHRRHHAESDTANDPHTPHNQPSKLAGLWYAHIGWMFDDTKTDDLMAYVGELYKERFLLRLDRRYALWVLLGLLVPTLIAGLVTRSWVGAAEGFLWSGMVRIFLVQHAIWSINSICHVFGARPFQSRDRSTNNIWLAVVTLGGSLHNTHHAFPSTAKNGLAFWQPDFSYRVIWLLERFGLAWSVKIPAPETVDKRRMRA